MFNLVRWSRGDDRTFPWRELERAVSRERGMVILFELGGGFFLRLALSKAAVGPAVIHFGLDIVRVNSRRGKFRLDGDDRWVVGGEGRVKGNFQRFELRENFFKASTHCCTIPRCSSLAFSNLAVEIKY